MDQPSLLDLAADGPGPTATVPVVAILSPDDRAALIAAAIQLADSQIPFQRDEIGFSNADVFIGRSLAAAVEYSYANDAQERFLALLVAQKYRRQAAPMLGLALERIAEYGRTAPERERVKQDLAEPLRVKRMEDGRFLVESEHRHNYFLRGLNVEREASGVASISRLVFDGAAACSEFVRRVTASAAQVRVVGEAPTQDEISGDQQGLKHKIEAEAIDERVRLRFDYDVALVEAVKRVAGRRFDSATKSWEIPLGALAQAIEVFEIAGGETSQLRALAPDYDPQGDHRFKVAVERSGKRLRFPGLPYDPKLVEGFRQISSSRFDKEKKNWSVEAADAIDLVAVFDEFSATIDAAALREFALNVAPEIEAPITIADETRARLRDYQEIGVEFLTRPLSEIRGAVRGGRALHGTVLGDDMGIGKTCQSVIAAHALASPEEPILVVCPANLRLNWQKEIRKFLGEEPRICVVGGNQGVDAQARFVIVNYELLPRYHEDLKALQPSVLIIDEAHYIKNPKALRSIYLVGGSIPNPEYDKEDEVKRLLPKKLAVEGLCDYAKRVFPMTGTPMPNRVRDSYNLWKAIRHPVAANKRRFDERYCGGHEERVSRDRVVWVNDGATNLEELRELVAPVFLQRKKADVLSLPLKQRTFMPVEVEHADYNRVLQKYKNKRPYGQAIAIALLTEQRMATAIGKAAATAELTANSVEQGSKVLIFSKSTQALDVIQKKLTESLGADEMVRLDGTMDLNHKQEAVDRFQEEAGLRVFLGQIDAAGTGFNLTAANHVIINDLDYVPSTMLQAEDRAFRDGQTQQVQITYMVADGTIDEDIAPLLEVKLDAITTFEGVENVMLDQLRERMERRLEMQQESPSYRLVSGL